jgi:hypothetical protein
VANDKNFKVKNGIDSGGVITSPGGSSSNWNTAFSWGDHAGLYSLVGHVHPYLPLDGGTLTGDLLTSHTSATPIQVTRTTGTNINIKYTSDSGTTYMGQGATSGTMRIGTTPDLIGTGNEVWHYGNLTTTSVANWNTAYNWGDHAGLYSLVGHVHPYLPLDGGALTGSVSSNSPISTTYNVSDGTVTMYGFGLTMSRGDSYIRPTVTNTQTLHIGAADTSLNWVHVDTKVSNTFRVNSIDVINSDGEIVSAVALPDNVKATFGDGEDLQIYHDGSYSYIKENGTGDLRIQGSTNVQIWNSALDKQAANFNAGGAQTLYYDNAAKLATASTGIDVTGTVIATGGNSTNWNTAYGWGDHASAGYYLASNPNGYTDDQTAAEILTAIKTVDGSSSGLDADLLDGQHGSYYAPNSSLGNYLPLAGGTLTGNLAINNGSPELYFGTTGNHYNWRIAAQELVDAGFEIAVGSQDTDYSNDTYVNKFVVKASGNVGIGTNNPDSYAADANNLVIYSATETGMTIVSGTASTGDIYFADGTSALNRGYLQYHHADDSMRFGTAATESMRIDSAGNVGIGVSNPSDYYTNFNDLVLGNTSTHSGMTIASGTSYDGTIAFADGTSGTAEYSGYIQYHHGTDSLSVGTAGTERLRIDSSGKVGIGTTAPSSLLDVRGGLGANGTAATPTAYFINSQSGATSGSIYIGASSGIDWRIGKNVTGILGNVNFSIADSSGNRRFDIDATGNVGIGTSSPEFPITAYGSSNQVYIGSVTPSVKTVLASDETNLRAYIGTRTNHPISFVTDGDERMRISSAGFVGIGTSSPQRKLAVEGTGVIFNNTGGAHEVLFGDAAYRYFSLYTPASPEYMSIRTGSTDLLTVKASGNVGIGTSSPVSALDVSAEPVATSGSLIRARNTAATASNTTFGGVFFSSSPGTDYSIGKSNINSVTTLSFRNGNTGASYMDIDSSGKVGIGTSSPVYGLDVRNTIYSSVAATTTNLTLGDSTNGTISGISTNNNNLIFLANGSAESMRIDSSGKVGIGTSSPTSKLQIGGMAAGEQALLIESPRNDALSNGLVRINITDSVCPFAGLQIDHAGTGAAIIANGNVGIGTSSPDSKIHLNDGALHIQQTDGSDTWFGYSANNDNYITTGASGITVFRAIGTERMRIDASGNLLVGTTTALGSSGTTLSSDGYVSASNDNIALYLNRQGIDGAIAEFRKGGTAVGSIGVTSGSIAFGQSNTGLGAFNTDRILFPATSSGAVQDNAINLGYSGGRFKDLYLSGTIALTTADNASAANIFVSPSTDFLYLEHPSNGMIFRNTSGTERMRIDSLGHVGIGVSPYPWGADYDVIDLNTGGAIYGTTTGLSVSANLYFTGSAWLTKTTGPGTLYATHSGKHFWYNSASAAAGTGAGLTERMTLDASGNVGIGAGSPTTSLTLGTGTTGVSFQSGNLAFNSGKIAVIKPIELGTGNGHLVFETYEGGSGGGERMRITSSGELQVTGNGVIKNQISDGNFSYLQQTSSDARLYVQYSQPLLFGTNNTERMRILADGSVVQGNTASLVASNYNNQAGAAWHEPDEHYEIATTGNRSPLEIGKNNANDGSLVVFRKQSNVVGSIGTTGGNLQFMSGSVGVGVGDDNLYPANGSGNSTDAALDIGDSVARFKNLYLSGYAYVGALKTNASIESFSNLTFWVPNVGEAVRIQQNTGNVGIGTSSPVSLLTVGNNATNATAISISTPFATNNYGDLVFTSEGTTTYNARIRATVPGDGTRELSFITAKNASENTVMTLDGDGNVGIGTTAPGAKLEISGKDDAGASDLLRLQFDNSPGDTGITFTDIFSGIQSRFTIDSTNTNDLRISSGTKIHLYGGTTNGTTSPHLTVSNDGNVGIGTTAPSEKLHVSGNILATGNITAYSDRNLKENIEPILNAVEKVQQLNGVTYSRNDLEDTTKRYAGIIAQDLQAVLPEAVEGDSILRVDYNATIGLLIEAIKELKTEVDDLKAKLKEETK